jgi:hypothetical protein
MPALGEGLWRHPTSLLVTLQMTERKTALCLPGARPEPCAPGQPLLASFLRFRSGLGCCWSASGGDGSRGGSQQNGCGVRGGGARSLARSLAPAPEHVPRSGRRSWKRSAGLAPTPAARGGGGTLALARRVKKGPKPGGA